uniref:Uncharacterized protein n=1 Tax=Podoviridae sp. ctuQh21 TaxID=2825284 RepID=A0A8S5PES9_9CAUD|nr:MAG TPA: hypothetical protein [Podoviridae sp. ctuQh21]DAT30021.1 MAG TPA: hypothetical protein [Caudoviricetes sp.]
MWRKDFYLFSHKKTMAKVKLSLNIVQKVVSCLRMD